MSVWRIYWVCLFGITLMCLYLPRSTRTLPCSISIAGSLLYQIPCRNCKPNCHQNLTISLLMYLQLSTRHYSSFDKHLLVKNTLVVIKSITHIWKISLKKWNWVCTIHAYFIIQLQFGNTMRKHEGDWRCKKGNETPPGMKLDFGQLLAKVNIKADRDSRYSI